MTENFKTVEPLIIHDETRTIEPSISRLKARVQGQILFIGDYWLTMTEATALRDWLTAVLPEAK
jgi:hypothetical protein